MVENIKEKSTLCYCIPNLQKLVYQVPPNGEDLLIIIVVIIIIIIINKLYGGILE